jgi:predicted NBD/HSP70 family sugar kinase
VAGHHTGSVPKAGVPAIHLLRLSFVVECAHHFIVGFTFSLCGILTFQVIGVHHGQCVTHIAHAEIPSAEISCHTTETTPKANIDAAKNDDNLSIELIEEAGEKVGKAVAFLINTFNPETVIVGGNLAAAGDYIMLPLKSATNKYSLNLVYKDTKFRVSKMTENANAWGVAMLIRNKIIGL